MYSNQIINILLLYYKSFTLKTLAGGFCTQVARRFALLTIAMAVMRIMISLIHFYAIVRSLPHVSVTREFDVSML